MFNFSSLYVFFFFEKKVILTHLVLKTLLISPLLYGKRVNGKLMLVCFASGAQARYGRVN